MFKILPLYGIPEQIIIAIKALYINTNAKVLTPDEETEQFDTLAGVLQGHTFAPFLFILVLDYVLRISLDSNNNHGLFLSSKQCSRRPAQYLTDLDFADDLALIAESMKNAEALLQSLEEAAAAVGPLCNETKTEFISASSDSIHSLSGAPWPTLEPPLNKLKTLSILGHILWNQKRILNPERGWLGRHVTNWIRFGTLTSTIPSKSASFKQLSRKFLCMAQRHGH